MEDGDETDDSILSFQTFLEPESVRQLEELSDSHRGGDSSDNEDDGIDMESDDEPLEQQIQQLMPWKNRQNAGRKKPGPKRLSSQQGRSTNIPDVDAYDPRTCGMYFLF